MNTLIIQDKFQFNNENITIIGSINKPYFKAKEVAEILGYKDIKDTLQRLVDDKYKLNYLQIYEELVGETPPTK